MCSKSRRFFRVLARLSARIIWTGLEMMILAHIQEMLIALLCQSSYSHILLIFLQENYRFGKISEVIQSKYLLINLLMLLLVVYFLIVITDLTKLVSSYMLLQFSYIGSGF